jgi:peptidoglycan hydrolase-like protein with peptidoglycan-binding domain
VSLRGVLSGTVVVLIAAVAGAAGALVLQGQRPPLELQAAHAPSSAATSTQQFSDDRTVRARFEVSDPVTITLPATGTVTATRCVPGRPLVSGAVAVRVNDEPVVVLHLSVPPYRELAKDVKGRDVAALQRELSRLGYRTNTDGVFGARTTAALKRFQRHLGIAKPDGRLKPAQVVWLRDRAITPSTCEVRLGATVAPGAALATIGGRLRAVRVAAVPADLVAGRRSLTAFGVTGPLGAGNVATDPKFLAAVAATAEYQAMQAEKSPDPATVTIALATPLDTVRVPPAAVFALNGARGCIQSGTRALPVLVVGSGLGSSLVTMAGQAPAAVNLGSAITATGCR